MGMAFLRIINVHIAIFQLVIRAYAIAYYLDSYQQRAVLDAMTLNDCTPSHAQSIRLKKLAQEGLLDDQTIYAVLAETKPNQQEQLKFKREELRKYFPSGYTEEQMRRDIIKGLELLKRQRERNRDAR